MTKAQKAELRNQLGLLVDGAIRRELRRRKIGYAKFDKLVTEDLVFTSLALTGHIERIIQTVDTIHLRLTA